jgi:hypothetical protein
VVASAPHYDPRILRLLRALDDRAESMAEVCRRVARAAEQLGLTRPSYVHLRTYLAEQRMLVDRQRDYRDALRGIAIDVAADLVNHRLVNAYDVAGRVAEARRKTLG